MAKIAEELYLFGWQIVPRSFRPGGACHLHLDWGWPVADLVIRGGWKKFESTQSYLNTGAYASLQMSLLPVLAQEAKDLAAAWPRGLPLPASTLTQMPQRLVERFLKGGASWGMEDAGRAAPSATNPALRTRV